VGTAAILAENERLRQLLAARDTELAKQAAELVQKDAALALRDAEIEALKASNDDLARAIELARLKRDGARNERYVLSLTKKRGFRVGTAS
jgi:hypothetical protein